MKKAALVEIGGSHDACLYSQLLFLKDAQYEVHMICSENLKGRIQDYKIADHIISFDFTQSGDKQALKQIGTYLRTNSISHLIFNTAQGKLVKDLLKQPLPVSLNITGTIHDAKKIKHSFTQYLISRKVKKYFVLNDYMLPFVPARKGISVESYYPVYFPEYHKAEIDKKLKDEIWIVIPGQLEYKRRDYLTLAIALNSIKERLPLKFIILGNGMHQHGDGSDFMNRIKELGVEHYFKIWDKFVDDSTFHSYINACDYVMPLMHPGLVKKSEFEGYNKYQVTGAFVLAISYKKSLLMFEGFDQYDDFKTNAYFYSKDTLPNLLMSLPELVLNHKKVFEDAKWDFDVQCKKYINFIES